jgi:hypothetical protein
VLRREKRHPLVRVTRISKENSEPRASNYPDSPAYYPNGYYVGDYWCYMPENADRSFLGWPPGWKPVDPRWQSGTGFSPGEFPD